MMNHKKHLTAFLLSLAALAFVGCNGEKGLRYMSYNIKNGCGMDNKTDYTRIASVIKQENPDVVAIQELDSVTKRSGQKYVLGELARLTGLHATYAA
ncbi:MAG TPA: endonuclease, partial [Parabacteroides sp.]|nr:endonuclease [Parabacteroides sp.]